MYKRRCDFLLDFIFYSETMQTTDKKLRYPLGGDLYAYVNTRRRDGVKIHIRHFQLSMDTKGGVKPTTRGVKMDAKTLRRLFAMKKQLTEARQYHSSLAVIIRLKASQGPQEYVVCYGPGRQALDAD